LFLGYAPNAAALFVFLSLVGTGLFEIHLSVPLVLEYREVLSRELSNLYLTATDIENLIEFYCSVAMCHQIFFLWRPFLPDPKDDMVLELAVKARCDSVVTYNTRDFVGIEQFGLKTVTPADILRSVGALP
jgi:predicted nucleic acid-binding protein